MNLSADIGKRVPRVYYSPRDAGVDQKRAATYFERNTGRYIY